MFGRFGCLVSYRIIPCVTAKVRHINSSNGSKGKRVRDDKPDNKSERKSVPFFAEGKELYKLGRLIESFGELVYKFRLWGCGNSRNPCAILFDFKCGNFISGAPLW